MTIIPSGAGSNVVSDDDLLPIRALNDLLFCERRCVLHHREKVWVENRYTLEGTAAHSKVHAEPTDEELGAMGRLSRNVWLRSDRLKLVGVADLVEFRAPSSMVAGTRRAPKPYTACADYVDPAECHWLRQCCSHEGGSRKKGTVPICAKHPPGHSGKWGLSPFSGPGRRGAGCGSLSDRVQTRAAAPLG